MSAVKLIEQHAGRKSLADVPWVRLVGQAWAPVATVVVLLLVWQSAVVVLDISPLILPSPLRIFSELVGGWEGLLQHGVITLMEAALGLVSGAVVGVLLAILIDQIAILRRSIFPLLLISQMVPAVVFAPIILVWFGFGLPSKVLIATIVCVFPMVINTGLGFRSIPHEMVELADSVSASKLRRLVKIRIPFTRPYIFAALKPATTLAIIGAIIGEFLGGDEGLGFVIVRDIRFLALPHMFATVVALVVLGVFMYTCVYLLEKAFIPRPRQMRRRLS